MKDVVLKTTEHNTKRLPSCSNMNSSRKERCFHCGPFILLISLINIQNFLSPELQKHTTWLCEFQALKKVREIEYTVVWFWSSLAIWGSGGGLVWPQIHEIRVCLPNLTDGMETHGILLALTSKSVYLIVLWQALSFKERVFTDGRSINSCRKRNRPNLWATWGHVSCTALKNMNSIYDGLMWLQLRKKKV